MNRLLNVLLLSTLCFFAGCSKAPAPKGTLTLVEVRSELSLEKVPEVRADDNNLAILDHAWAEKQVYSWVASRWHDRAYVAELKDCDDYTDDLVHFIRRAFREHAADKGGAAVGPLDVLFPQGWHQIALLRTDRGWFVIDPQVFNSKTRTLNMVPLSQYPQRSRYAKFGT